MDRLLDFWVFGYLYSGELNIQIGQEKARLETGSFYVFPPGIRHFGLKDDISDIYYVHFRAAGRKISKDAKLTSSKIQLPLFGKIDSNIPILGFFNNLIASRKTGLPSNKYYEEQFIALLSQINFAYLVASKGESAENRLPLKILSYLNAVSMQKEFKIHEIENKFALSYRHLNRIFKKEYNTSMHEKFMELKIDKAYQLLINGMSLKDIAEKTGFEDYFYFLKVFKKFKKSTPKTLKKKYFSK